MITELSIAQVVDIATRYGGMHPDGDEAASLTRTLTTLREEYSDHIDDIKFILSNRLLVVYSKQVKESERSTINTNIKSYLAKRGHGWIVVINRCTPNCHIRPVENDADHYIVECPDCNAMYILTTSAFERLKRGGYVVP